MIRRIFKKLVGSYDSRKKSTGSSKTVASPSGKKSRGKPGAVSNKPDLKARSPEAICGIDSKTMDKDAIRDRLAELYRRHNRAAGSLNDELREEAEQMLDAIVVCREKYVGDK